MSKQKVNNTIAGVNDLIWSMANIEDEVWGIIDYAIPPIEDAEFEIIQPKELLDAVNPNLPSQ